MDDDGNTRGVVSLVARDKLDQNRADADALRRYADEVERGEIKNWCFVGDHIERFLFSYGSFEHRWHLLGAIEYAKTQVHEQP